MAVSESIYPTTFLTIKQSLQVYKDIHAPNPDFGMDIHSSEVKLEDVILLNNNGKTNNSVPIRCDHFVVILCLKGSGNKQINHHEFVVKAKSLHILSPGQIQSFKNSSKDFKFFALLFDQNFLSKFNLPAPILNDLLNLDPDIVPSFDLSENTYSQVFTIFEQLNMELRETQHYGKEITKMLINQLFYLIKRFSAERKNDIKTTSNRASEIVNSLRKLIELHFLKVKSVNEYANLMHISPKHLSQTVKSQTGNSALYFIHQRILNEAEFLLVYSNFNIKQISDMLNFEAPSHFSRFFEKKLKMAPLHYKKKFKK